MYKFENYKIIIDDIVDSILDKQFCVFCGAGATADSTNIEWVDLLKKELDILGDNKPSDNYRIAKYYELHFGRNKLINSIENLLKSNNNESNHIKQLLKLPISEFWTTNFDTIIEDMIINIKKQNPAIIYNQDNLFKINEKDEYNVFKLNGTISDSNSLVLTSDDYVKYFDTQKLLVSFLQTKLITKTFLFIGYSFQDNLILECLNKINKTLSMSSHYHYRIIKYDNDKSTILDVESKYLENNYRIKTIFVNTYEEIDSFLEAIYRRVILHNVFISGSFRKLDDIEEDRADDICKELTNKLIENGFTIHIGNGKRLGSLIISNILKNSLKLGCDFKSKFVINQFIDHQFYKRKLTDVVEHKNRIRKMQKDCAIVVFMYGQYDDGISKGVLIEFEEAQKSNKYLIPIPSTHYAAEYLYNHFSNSKFPEYLIPFKDELLNSKTANEIANVVMNIINYIVKNET